METKELLNIYYEGFALKKGWENTIAEDFKFIGGDMTRPEPVTGRQAYIEIIKRFSRLFTSMRVQDMIIGNDRAFVRANYDYVFPGGVKINGDVAEVWEIRKGKLDKLTIFFDTLTFHNLTRKNNDEGN
jgi:ketosteroid isomerase-like protein